MKITYTKLSDAWGLRVSEGKVQAGQRVTVTTKAGHTKQEVIQKIIWSGDDKFSPGKKIQLCAIEQSRPFQNRRNYGGGERPAPDGQKCYLCQSRTCPGAWEGELCDWD
jgi:hypothetical protein